MATTTPLQTIDTAWINTQFEGYLSKLNGHAHHPLPKFRQAAFAVLEQASFPSRADEDWKYLPVQRILAQPYQEAVATAVDKGAVDALSLPELNAIRVVFVNGVLDAGHSQLEHLPAGLRIQKIGAALEDETVASWIQEQVQLEGGTAKNTFLQLNNAFAQDGLYIQVANNAIVERPIYLLFINTGSGAAYVSHPQLYVNAGKSSQLAIIEHYQSTVESANYLTNAAKWMSLAANSHLTHYRIQQEATGAFQVNNTIITQGKDSTYGNYALDLGGAIVRNNLSSTLLDSGTQTNYYGVYLADEEQVIDNQTFIDHAMPHCQSNELYKGLLKDRAKGVFNGKVMVRQDAQKTNAYQQNSSLVLSPWAVMDAKPQLEIYADDVRCSHGATIGHLDETGVFYLRSRGIPEQQAKQLLQHAFLNEVIEHFPLDAIQKSLSALILDKLQ